ncbi:hypothetical protein SAMD00019534_009140 [Acytostelium subglobosum LB1]|uniref:hypothetical protein n=1 Tax=Acytostelium subglobosum LB1 TaxID=1410327 RepID=UPI0006451232|nr:hypothetical protein SAMD00019534_009140 [Acytostelium subglobosum LB1]GAM17739.1 hypothetical protein SAMD00019534_009140 [Acytostelium subglobosum LB1]|eukprot:XP_012758335.1 hypothetical protein SAMD00019534_009140 [Acytostelium subglobosum LB1]
MEVGLCGVKTILSKLTHITSLEIRDNYTHQRYGAISFTITKYSPTQFFEVLDLLHNLTELKLNLSYNREEEVDAGFTTGLLEYLNKTTSLTSLSIVPWKFADEQRLLQFVLQSPRSTVTRLELGLVSNLVAVKNDMDYLKFHCIASELKWEGVDDSSEDLEAVKLSVLKSYDNSISLAEIAINVYNDDEIDECDNRSILLAAPALAEALQHNTTLEHFKLRVKYQSVPLSELQVAVHNHPAILNKNTWWISDGIYY